MLAALSPPLFGSVQRAGLPAVLVRLTWWRLRPQMPPRRKVRRRPAVPSQACEPRCRRRRPPAGPEPPPRAGKACAHGLRTQSRAAELHPPLAAPDSPVSVACPRGMDRLHVPYQCTPSCRTWCTHICASACSQLQPRALCAAAPPSHRLRRPTGPGALAR